MRSIGAPDGYEALADSRGSGNGATSAKGAKGGAKPDISIYGQEADYTAWRLAKINLAIRGIDGQIVHDDVIHNDRHPDLKADFILANQPFYTSGRGDERLSGDQRWEYGTPPARCRAPDRAGTIGQCVA